ncbi:hypothetical protein B0T10DRAFT_482577 [Thelonectria olida]|uniref:RNase MRP protein 1 RNA binding domain-containing protein n=1 Tax=Thelonectria olida TaxID=1576542 RepID=A0A9P8WAJ3_9HYPO|nr:hypothetical protein B0T10DRAFT_482577 [Thelonectria olida]
MPQQPPVTKSRSKAKPLQKNQTASSALSKEALSQTHDSLANILALLKSFAHRHHNQHHSSHWWRSFGLLRRAARSLAASLLRHSRRLHDESPALVYARWIADHIVPGAYVAFTQLAADNQHAPLGLMLLAVLAHIRRLVSDLLPSDNPAPEADSSVAGSINPTTPTSRPKLKPSSLEIADPDQDVDMGVAVSRNDLALPKASSKQSDRLSTVETLPKDTKARKSAKRSSKDAAKDTSKDHKEKKKKKKKAGDAFSSLFSSL